ncbi:MAG: hypothetical protein K8T20_09095 [Planctomycetes bacterium]|nr:hypothetical protein [Planctomycetota bacterium]
MRLLAVMFAVAMAAGTASAQAVEMKNPPKMTLSVVLKEKPDKNVPGKLTYTLTGSGEAAYPDGVNLQFGLHLKDDSNFIIRAQGYVTAGRFEIELPELGNKSLYHGMYTCQVDFDPELQVSNVMNKLPADKRGRNNAKCEQKIGTDAEIAEELEEVLGFYKGEVAKLKGLYDAIKAEYEAQLVTKDKDKWRKVASPAQDKLMDLDSELANWRKKRMNVMKQELYETLSGAILTLKDFGIDAYTTQLAFEGKPPKESAVAQHEEVVVSALDKLQKATAGAKAPEEPKK